VTKPLATLNEVIAGGMISWVLEADLIESVIRA
jgi:hypothetical protein